MDQVTVTIPKKRSYRRGIYKQASPSGYMLMIRVSSATREQIYKAARKAGVPMSTLVRECMMQIAEKINNE